MKKQKEARTWHNIQECQIGTKWIGIFSFTFTLKTNKKKYQKYLILFISHFYRQLCTTERISIIPEEFNYSRKTLKWLVSSLPSIFRRQIFLIYVHSDGMNYHDDDIWIETLLLHYINIQLNFNNFNRYMNRFTI